MSIEDAIEILTEYQEWRTGKIKFFTTCPVGLSDAIEKAIEVMKQAEEETSDDE